MNWFRNSRIKTKLLAAFASVIVIVLIESAVTFRAVSTAEHTREQMLSAQHRNDKFRDFQTSLHQIEIGFTSFVLTGAPDAYQLYQDSAKRVDEELPDLKQSAAGDPQLLAAIAELEQDKRSFVEQAVAPTLKSRERMSQGDGTYETVVATLLGSQGFAVIQSANHTVNQLIEQLGRERDRAAAANASASASIQQTMIASTLAAIAIAFGIAFWLADFLSGSLRQLLEASRALSEGDTTVKIDIEGKDELGKLAANFRALVDYNRRIGLAAEALERGDLNVAIVPASERDRTAKELNKAMESIREVM
ncbi:MAG: HAMP domain-containing protein [Acidobacteriaceae bacterium]